MNKHTPPLVPPGEAATQDQFGLAALQAQERQAVKPTLHASPKLGAWLREVGGSLAFTTYQSARLFLLFAGEGDQQQVWRFSNVGSQVLGKFAITAPPRPAAPQDQSDAPKEA